MPEGLKRLEEGTFSGCTALQHIALPSTLQHIGKNAFFASGLYEVEIPAGVETIDQFAFYYNQNLEEVTIHGASTVIEENAFTRNAYFVCYMPATAVCDENAFNSDAEIRYID